VFCLFVCFCFGCVLRLLRNRQTCAKLGFTGAECALSDGSNASTSPTLIVDGNATTTNADGDRTTSTIDGDASSSASATSSVDDVLTNGDIGARLQAAFRGEVVCVCVCVVCVGTILM
jgi:hypothetical protein